MLINVTDKHMCSSMTTSNILREASIHITNAVLNKCVILPERGQVQ